MVGEKVQRAEEEKTRGERWRIGEEEEEERPAGDWGGARRRLGEKRASEGIGEEVRERLVAGG